MANVTSHRALCRRLLCHLIYHLIAASLKTINSRSVRLTWSAADLSLPKHRHLGSDRENPERPPRPARLGHGLAYQSHV